MSRIILFIASLLMIFIQSHGKLLYTISFIRHGSDYPRNDLYDGNQTKQFRGLLTGVGLRQQYLLGSYLKQTYITELELTTPKFNPNHVESFTTSYERTRSSALAFFYGFYPLNQGWTIPEEVGSDKLNPPFQPLSNQYLKVVSELTDNLPFALNKGFQAIPVYPLDDILDNCPSYGVLLSNRYKQIAQNVSTFQTQQSLQIAKMKLIFNLTALQTTVATMSDLYDTIYADQNLGRPLPKQYDSYDQKNMRYISEYYKGLVFGGNFARVLATPILKMIRQKLKSVINRQNSKKLTFVHCHESNLYPLLTVLNLTSTNCLTEKWKNQSSTALNCLNPPRYSSNLIFELHQDESFQNFVQIKYNGEYAYLCQSKQVKCRYQEFFDRLINIETDFQKQCKVTGTNQIGQ